jgi:hypothetical protein
VERCDAFEISVEGVYGGWAITIFASIHATLAVVSNLLLLSLFELRRKRSAVRIGAPHPCFN